jgi:serine/threonine-protein kinase
VCSSDLPEIRYADGEAMATDLHAVLVQLREQAREPAPPPVDAVSGGGGPAPGAPEAGHNP